MGALNEKLLDEKLAELEKLRAWSPRVVSKLESLLRSTDEWALFRVNPFAFGEERGIPEDEAVDLLLLASKVGLFQMTWSLLCSGCGAAVQSFATLRSVCSMFHCYLCSIDTETRLDDFVHVGFTVAPNVRAIAAHDPGSLSVEDLHLRYHFTRETRVAPGGPRFVDVMPEFIRGMRYIEPGAIETFEFDLEPGALAAHDIISNNVLGLVVPAGAKGPNPVQRFRLGEKAEASERTLAPGRVILQVENATGRRTPVMLFAKPQATIDEAMALVAAGKPATMSFDKFLSGRRLLTSHTFRQVFGNETIRSAEGIGVRDVSILFTDLKGSTSMYDRIGDLKAFALVNQHFERLGRAIVLHRGAVVKTIGDAVMASFENPADAVQAARDMLREIASFNREGGEGKIVLKVGIHRGASIAVTLNERLDYFGQTVNIAARVQALADADEIYLTEDVFTAPGVGDLVRELHVSSQDAHLKGVQRAVRVFRVAATPPAANAHA